MAQFYHVLDFSHWQDKASFDRQFKKLLEGLTERVNDFETPAVQY